MATKTATNAWKKVRIDQCFDIQQGKQVSKSNRLGRNQHPFLRTANVFWGELDLATLDHMHFTEAEEERLALRKGDLLVCEGGDVGRTAMWHDELERCYYQNHLHRLRKNTDEIDENFVLLYLQYAFVYAKLYFGRANVTTIPNLSKSRLSELEIAQPSLVEQKAIAQTLTTIQNAIAEQEKLVAKLQELKRSMMKHLFTHGTKDEKTKLTEIGEMPESWDVTKMGSICKNELRNGAFARRNQFGSGYLFANVVDMYGGLHLGYDKLERVNLPEKEILRFALKDGDILFVRSSLKRDGVAQCSVVRNMPEMTIYDCHLIKAEIDTSLAIPEFVANYWRSDLGKRELVQRSKTTTMTTINQNGLEAASLPLPSLIEQGKIIDALQSVDEKVSVAKAKLVIYGNLFKTLLHELMSGERRIQSI